MANTKISALTQLTATTDVADKIPIVDDSATETKYINPDDLFGATTAINWQVKCGSNGIDIANGALTIDGASTTGTVPDAGADNIVIDTTGAGGITILSTTFSNIYAGDAASATIGKLGYDHSNNRWGVTANGTESLRVTGSGIALYDGSAFGDALNKFVTRTSWTPQLEFGGATTGITYARQSGYYMQIGPIVIIECRIELSSKGSATGTATITGLPVTESAVANLNGAMFFSRLDDLAWAGMPHAYIQTSTINLYETTSTNSRTVLDDVDFENATDIELWGLYFA